MFAAMGVMSGQQDLVVAGGVESMSRPAPAHVDGFTANNAHLREQYDMVPQGISADLIATLGGFTREQCDELALESQRRAGVAIVMVETGDDPGHAPSRATYERAGFQRWPVAGDFREV